MTSSTEAGPAARSPAEPGPAATSQAEPGPAARSQAEPGPAARSPAEPGPAARSPAEPGPHGRAEVSVVVPTYNDVRHLGEALESILAQSVTPIELIVADDGSDDGTELLVKELAARHAERIEIRYLRLPSRSGVVAARNAGIAAARGEWIACCDSDDFWAPARLERQLSFVREWKGRERIALLGTHGYNVNDARRIVSPARMAPTTEDEYEELRRRGGMYFVIHSSVLYRRADWEAVGGYSTEYGAADDYHFFCLMAERGVVLNLPEPLVYYRKRAGSVQLAQFWDQREGMWRLAENQRRSAAGEAPIGPEQFAAQLASESARERFRRRRRVWGMYYYRLGATHLVNGRRLRGSLELLLASTMDGSRVRAGVLNAIGPRRAARSGRGGEALDV